MRVRNLARRLNDDQLRNDFDSLNEKHKEVIEKVKCIRNKTVAHDDKDCDDVRKFEEVGVTPNEIKSLIEDICKMLNATVEMESFTNRIPEELCFKNAVHSLLDRLGNG